MRPQRSASGRYRSSHSSAERHGVRQDSDSGGLQACEGKLQSLVRRHGLLTPHHMGAPHGGAGSRTLVRAPGHMPSLCS
jgi:hypothetical protein